MPGQEAVPVNVSPFALALKFPKCWPFWRVAVNAISSPLMVPSSVISLSVPDSFSPFAFRVTRA